MTEKYELILLDADGTIFDYDTAEGLALEKAFAEHSWVFDRATHLADYRAINSRMWLDFELGRVSQAGLRTERFRLLFERHGLSAEISVFSQIYLKHLAQGAFLVEGAEEVCTYLADRYSLAILTNGIREVQFARIGAHA